MFQEKIVSLPPKVAQVLMNDTMPIIIPHLPNLVNEMILSKYLYELERII